MSTGVGWVIDRQHELPGSVLLTDLQRTVTVWSFQFKIPNYQAVNRLTIPRSPINQSHWRWRTTAAGCTKQYRIKVKYLLVINWRWSSAGNKLLTTYGIRHCIDFSIVIGAEPCRAAIRSGNRWISNPPKERLLRCTGSLEVIVPAQNKIHHISLTL